AAASQLASLGAFYAMRARTALRGAGVLSAAFDIRRELLGADHQGTVQIALILGPVYADMGRLNDAEKLYLDAFHAQEKVKGANSPDLSLYIKLLAGIYERQGRATEAQALYEHMRSLFRDAFGAQRYAVNRARDRRADINRPVSQYFVLSGDYAPTDLVPASDFSVPLSKNADLDEMKLRRAADEGADPREANLPARLAQLISLCRAESGERVTLRSGYRSYKTQKDLFDRIGYKGTVTPPGMSEHQLGLAVDIDVDGRLMRRSDGTYQCFEENAFRFGFTPLLIPGNDYLPGEDSYEPWHWRYVGISTAQLYREAGPDSKPQEFLAALPCYQERAASGSFTPAGETDLCLAGPTVVAASANIEHASQPAGEKAKPARKLNNGAHGAGSQ
ncbi:MAG: tetratricopeptide repeat protein, partial [Rhodomicrobium sp.]|nr:tetratricopeptide repeat protein [Rhodomicrobium sp.]